ncbi:MAG: TolC family protein [Prevotella sp.]|nr:TolC family protein [Prevotella sp.]
MKETRIRTIVVTMLALLCMPILCCAQNDNTAMEMELEPEAVLHINLQKAVEIALEENPTIKVADKEIRLKQISNDEAWQNLLPTVSGTGSIQHTLLAAKMKFGDEEFTMGKNNTNTAALTGTVNLPLFAPAVYQSMKLTRQDVLLAKEKARASRLDLVNQVTKAFYQLLVAKKAMEVMQQSYKVSSDNYNLINSKFEVGTVSEYDKISAEVQQRAMSSNLVEATTATTMAELQLKVLMGITTDVRFIIDDELENHASELIISNTNDVAELTNNTTMRQLDLNYKLLQKNLKLQYTNFMPTLGFQLTGQYQSLYNDNWDLFNYNWSPSASFAISLNIPIFTASNWTKIKSTRVQMLQLEDTRENTRRQLSMALESYRENMLAAIAAMESNKVAVEQANKAVKIAEARYNVGNGTILELNQSEVAMTQAELTYAQSIYTYLVNRSDFDYTLGREKY